MKKTSKYLIFLFIILFFISSSLLIINYSKKVKLQKDIDQTYLNGSTLPGATDINPAVMYNGNIYYWESMAGPSYKLPQGSLPKGYENVGDIIYNSSGNLTEELQFTATFDATGQLYYNKDNPDKVYICITTYWLENAYVKFSK